MTKNDMFHVELFTIWIVWNETSAYEKWAVRKRNVQNVNLSSAELQNVYGIQYTAQNAGFTLFLFEYSKLGSLID